MPRTSILIILLFVLFARALLLPAANNSAWTTSGTVSNTSDFRCAKFDTTQALRLSRGASVTLVFVGGTRFVLYLVPMGGGFSVKLDDGEFQTYGSTLGGEVDINCTDYADTEVRGGIDQLHVVILSAETDLTLVGVNIVGESAHTVSAPGLGEDPLEVATGTDTSTPGASTPGSSNTGSDTTPQTPTHATTTSGSASEQTTVPPTKHDDNLPTGAVAGIAVAVAVPFFALLIFVFYRRRMLIRRRADGVAAEPYQSPPPHSTLSADEGSSGAGTGLLVTGKRAKGASSSTAFTPGAGSSVPTGGSRSSPVTPPPAPSTATPNQPDPEMRELYHAMHTAGFTVHTLFDRLRGRHDDTATAAADPRASHQQATLPPYQ